MTASGTLGLYPKFRADDLDGHPLEGGRLYAYLSGTSTPQTLYADAELTTALPHPLILDSSGEALFYYGPATYKLALHDAADVPLWLIDPVTGPGSGASAGVGWGQNTVELRPATGTSQVAASVFPPDVLALGLTLWIDETFGTSQGLHQIGIGTAQQPDQWGVLPTLSAATDTTAGYFQGYSGQPQRPPVMVTLTAYGGLFDGTGAVYLTGHFCTLTPSHQLGTSYVPPSGSVVQPVPPATTDSPGLVELATTPEHLDGLRGDRAVTPVGLQAKLDSLTPAPPPSFLALPDTPNSYSGQAGKTVVVNAGASALEFVTAPSSGVAPGTALSVARYASGGASVEASSPTTVVDASGRLGVGTATPAYLVDVSGGDLRLFGGLLRHHRDAASANHFQETYATSAAFCSTLTAVRGGGTQLSPAAAPLNANLFSLTVRGHDGTAQQTGATLSFTATGQYSATDRGTRVVLSTVASGSTTNTERLRIDGNGYVGIATAAPRFPLHVTGALAYGLPTAEPLTTDLSNGQIAWWLNETDNTLRAVLKRSDGTVRRASVTTTT